MAVFVSSGAFNGVHSLESLLPLCREHGIYDIELSSGLKVGGEDLLASLADTADFNFLLHNYFPVPAKAFVLNLADRNEGNRTRSIRFCQSALEHCSALKIPFYSVHAGFVASLRPEDLGRPERQTFTITAADYEEALLRFADSVAILAQDAKRLGLRLLIENNVDGVGGREVSHLLLVSGSDIVRFFETHPHTEVGLLLDLAHLRVSASHHGFDAVSAVEQVAPWIEALHLSDNDGFRDSNQVCHEDSWFWEPLNHWCRDGVTTVLESYRLNPQEIQAQRQLIARKLPFTH